MRPLLEAALLGLGFFAGGRRVRTAGSRLGAGGRRVRLGGGRLSHFRPGSRRGGFHHGRRGRAGLEDQRFPHYFRGTPTLELGGPLRLAALLVPRGAVLLHHDGDAVEVGSDLRSARGPLLLHVGVDDHLARIAAPLEPDHLEGPGDIGQPLTAPQALDVHGQPLLARLDRDVALGRDGLALRLDLPNVGQDRLVLGLLALRSRSARELGLDGDHLAPPPVDGLDVHRRHARARAVRTDHRDEHPAALLDRLLGIHPDLLAQVGPDGTRQVDQEEPLTLRFALDEDVLDRERRQLGRRLVVLVGRLLRRRRGNAPGDEEEEQEDVLFHLLLLLRFPLGDDHRVLGVGVAGDEEGAHDHPHEDAGAEDPDGQDALDDGLEDEHSLVEQPLDQVAADHPRDQRQDGDHRGGHAADDAGGRDAAAVAAADDAALEEATPDAHHELHAHEGHDGPLAHTDDRADVAVGVTLFLLLVHVRHDGRKGHLHDREGVRDHAHDGRDGHPAEAGEDHHRLDVRLARTGHEFADRLHVQGQETQHGDHLHEHAEQPDHHATDVHALGVALPQALEPAPDHAVRVGQAALGVALGEGRGDHRRDAADDEQGQEQPVPVVAQERGQVVEDARGGLGRVHLFLQVGDERG